MSLLQVNGLTKTFGGSGRSRRRSAPHVAVAGVSFTLEASRTLAVVGESGAGKSTTGRLVLRLIEPDLGEVSFDGVDLLSLSGSRLRRQRRQMQMVFQDPRGSFNPLLRVGYSVAEPLKTHFAMNKTDREQAVADAFRRVGLDPQRAMSYPRQLSGGQLQRIAIARALTLQPKLIVCDEIVSALDASVRARIIDLMLELQADLKTAFIFITQDLALAEDFAHDTLVMKSGQVVEYGPTASVFSNPQQPYTAELLAATPRLERLLSSRQPDRPAVPVSLTYRDTLQSR